VLVLAAQWVVMTTAIKWIEIDAYTSWQSLVLSVEKILKEFGENYVINFV
jgi:hypothetical protein